MAGGTYSSMAAMMGTAGGPAPIPTQTFSAANVFGTPVPQVGDNKARPNYAEGVVNPKHVVLVAIALIGIGYLVYHLNFEK